MALRPDHNTQTSAYWMHRLELLEYNYAHKATPSTLFSKSWYDEQISEAKTEAVKAKIREAVYGP